MKEKLIDLAIFLFIVITTISFFFLRTKSMNEEQKDETLLKEMVESAYPDLKETPEIITIKDKKSLERLSFSKYIDIGDQILIYESKKKAVFVDSETENIIGITYIR